MSRSIGLEHPASGFTLIEALVALSIVAIALSAISSLIASSVRGTRSIEANLTRLAAARTVMAALPDRDQLGTAHLSGHVANHRWFINVSSYETTSSAQQPRLQWTPQSVVITIQSPSTAPLQIHTVRLRKDRQK